LSGAEAYAADQKSVKRFWKTEDPEAASFFHVAARTRDLLKYWPEGWEYWDGITPEQLDSYLTRQFKGDLENVVAQGGHL
jgi:hypothetical protein